MTQHRLPALLHRSNLFTMQSYFDSKLRSSECAHWLFIFTFPNGGSTALADLLGSSSRARRLTSDYEGQRLIPELMRLPDRALEKPLVSSRKLRANWLRKALKNDDGQPFVVIEKSPDSMFRHRHIQASFAGMVQHSIVLTREPLPTCASWIKRYDITEMARRWAGHFGIPCETDDEILRILARIWLRRAEYLRRCNEDAALLISYEELCTDTERYIELLVGLEPLLADVDAGARLSVKDYRPEPIRNMNEDNLAYLTGHQIDVLSAELRKNEALIGYFGYAI